jgi:hypothetical protein
VEGQEGDAVTQVEKDAVFEAVQARATAFARERGIPETATCLYLAYYGAFALAERGLRPLLQAGSAGWPRVRPEDDDGKRPTYFSYMWTPGELPSQRAIGLGHMPEMHVWLGLPDSGEIVDFSTGLFPAQARAIMEYDWPQELLPPAYYWGGREGLGRACYAPDMDAIGYALSYVRDTYGAVQLAALLALGATAVSPSGRPGKDSHPPGPAFVLRALSH